MQMHSVKRVLLKAVLLGDSGVGKTSLLDRYVNNQFKMSYKTTIGADFLTKDIELDSHQSVTLQLWDTAGQERFSGLGSAFYRGADCCILVFDVTSQDSFYHLEQWRKEFMTNSNLPDAELKLVPFVVVGNKIDQHAQRVIQRKDAEKWAESVGMKFFETSARDAINVSEMFHLCANAVLKSRHAPEVSQIDVETRATVQLNASELKKETSCYCLKQ